MNRRRFLIGLPLSATAFGTPARAQVLGKPLRIGFLTAGGTTLESRGPSRPLRQHRLSFAACANSATATVPTLFSKAVEVKVIRTATPRSRASSWLPRWM